MRCFAATIHFVQQESGGSYQNGKIRSLHRGLDLREAENIWCNEKDERADYNAWWYCCIPISVIREKGFPLPVFLHCDDVEYGLRSGREPIRMNGICVWHDAFEQKRPSVNEYYDVRNALIVNGLYVTGVLKPSGVCDGYKTDIGESVPLPLSGYPACDKGGRGLSAGTAVADGCGC